MQWTAMHWVVLALLLIIVALLRGLIWAFERIAELQPPSYLPTARQRRRWKRERLEFDHERINRRIG